VKICVNLNADLLRPWTHEDPTRRG
jgi:hypothetical protein